MLSVIKALVLDQQKTMLVQKSANRRVKPNAVVRQFAGPKAVLYSRDFDMGTPNPSTTATTATTAKIAERSFVVRHASKTKVLGNECCVLWTTCNMHRY